MRYGFRRKPYKESERVNSFKNREANQIESEEARNYAEKMLKQNPICKIPIAMSLHAYVYVCGRKWAGESKSVSNTGFC